MTSSNESMPAMLRAWFLLPSSRWAKLCVLKEFENERVAGRYCCERFGLRLGFILWHGQRRFGRAIEFCGVTKPGCCNGAAKAGWSGAMCRSIARAVCGATGPLALVIVFISNIELNWHDDLISLWSGVQFPPLAPIQIPGK